MVRRDYWIERVEKLWGLRSIVWLTGVRRVGVQLLTLVVVEAAEEGSGDGVGGGRGGLLGCQSYALGAFLHDTAEDAGTAGSGQLRQPVLPERPERVVGDFPGVAVGVGEVA